jgi:hypothetical protein
MSAAVGACIGGAAVLALGSSGRVDGPRPAPEKPASLAEPITTPTRPSKILLGWAPGGLPAEAEAAVEDLRGVRGATTVIAGLDWISATHAPDGSVIDRPGDGYAIPFESAVIEPKEYAHFVSPADRAAVEGLTPNEILLARTESRLRGSSDGTMVRFDGRVQRVAGTVADETTNGYEGLLAGPVPATWQRADSFVLVRLTKTRARKAVERTLRSLLSPGQVLRVRAQGETPFLRYGDAVLPQMLVKDAFGEFAARPLSTGSIQIQPGWVKRNIKTARVPILGRVVCHKALFPQLRSALRQVTTGGLTYAVDPDDYGGCYSPRFIDSNPGGRLSHHSWGIAIDINVAENAFNSRPDQDERLVKIMENQGFTWGGRWLTPDGMHFEWVEWP